MRPLTINVQIHAPVEAVWQELRAIERHVTWMRDAESITFANDQREGVGTVFYCRTRVGPFVLNDVMSITEWVPQASMGVTHRGLVTGEGTFNLRANDNGTHIEWSERLHFPWFLGGPVTALVARPVLRWIWQQNLMQLRQRITAA